MFPLLKKTWAAAAAGACVWSTAVQAVPVVIPPSGDAGALQQRQMELQRETERQQRQDKPAAEGPAVVAPTAPAAAPATSPEAAQVRFVLREVVFTESAYLSPAELQAVVAPELGKTISLADLNEVLAKVNALYAQRRIATASAVLQPQDVTDGKVLIRLVEGRVGHITVLGNATTDADFVRRRLGQAEGDLVDLDGLERAVTRMNRTLDVRLGVEVKPGQQFGTSDLFVGLQEPPRDELMFTLDNLGSRLTGEWRAGLSYRNRSVLGYRDDLMVSWTRAEGQDSRMLQYSFPFNRWGGRMSAGYFWDETEIGAGPLAALDVTGESQTMLFNVRQPVWVTPNWTVELTGGHKDRTSRNAISGEQLKAEHSKDYTYGVELQHFGADHHVIAGINEARVRIDPQPSVASKYVVQRGFARYTQLLPRDLSVRASWSWQTTPDDYLPSAEQMFLGGEGSVRGYPSGTYSGDRGHILSLELHHPVAQFESAYFGGVKVTGFGFIDHGDVKPYTPPGSVADVGERLTGLGWGFNANLGARHTLRVTAGVGLTKVKQNPEPPRQYQITVQWMALVF